MGSWVNARRALVLTGTLIFAIATSIFTSTASAQTVRTCGGVEATIVGTPGIDLLRGTEGDDVIVGLQGDDHIVGLGGDDIICGGRGNDNLYGDSGFDIIYGAEGDDKLYAALEDTSDTAGSRMFGGAGNDLLYGSERWDRMQGGPGSDTMFGFEGRDWMRGGADDDLVDGGAWQDDLHGGNGVDRLILTRGDTARGGAGFDICVISSSTTTTTSCVLERTPLLAGIPIPIKTIRAGDCLNGTIPSRSSTTATVIQIDCSEPHDYEVYREVFLPRDMATFDANAISTYAQGICQDSLIAYIGGPTDLRLLTIEPTEATFNDPVEPDRVVSCLLFSEGEQLVGRAN